MVRRYRFLVKFYFDHTPVLATLMVTTSTKKSSWRGWFVQFSLICSKMRAKKERTTTMVRRYRFLGEIIRPYTSAATLMVTTSTKKSSWHGWLFSCSKTTKRCGRYVTYILMQKHQSQFARNC